MTGKGKEYKLIAERISSGDIADQKCWQFIRELNSYSNEALNKVAMIDGKRKYTYRQMFRQWERYAEVFSSLNICGENRSRVAIIAPPALEPVFVYYALNITEASASMVSYMDLYNEARFEELLKKEGITDMVIADIFLRPDFLRELMRKRKKWKIRHIIVLHVELQGKFADPEISFYSCMNYRFLRTGSSALFMDDLLIKNEAYPIAEGSGRSADDAAIIHTSGTTKGIHKPIPLSDKALNYAAVSFLRHKDFEPFAGNLTSMLLMELASSYGFIETMHLPLAFGGTIVSIPLGALNPDVMQATSYYGVNVLFASARALDRGNKEGILPDLSGLEYAFVGGFSISAETKERCNNYLKDCGAKIRISNGYGLSEAGGACIIASPDREDDAIGYPVSGVKVKIYDEADGKYYDPDAGVRTGVMYISSPSLSSGKIDETVFFTLDEIDGEKYINTYDLVRVNEDGSITCIGRMDKYFVNNEGIKFDAGLVETAVAACRGIRSCGMAPEYSKLIHDTIPVLYVETTGEVKKAKATVRNALVDVFIRNGEIDNTNLPSHVVITKNIPYTGTGKVDVHQILTGDIEGARYVVRPVNERGELVDIRLISTDNRGYTKEDGIPRELEGDLKSVKNMKLSNVESSGECDCCILECFGDILDLCMGQWY